jgi:hypothetical protein
VGAASWDTLKRPGGIVLRSKADCLRIGAEGPILLIWPDGVGYGGVTPEPRQYGSNGDHLRI